MRLNIKAVNTLNPGQTPVDTSDCLIYALTKETGGTLCFILTMTFPYLTISWIPFYLTLSTRMISDFTCPKNSFLSMLNVETLFSNFV